MIQLDLTREELIGRYLSVNNLSTVIICMSKSLFVTLEDAFAAGMTLSQAFHELADEHQIGNRANYRALILYAIKILAERVETDQFLEIEVGEIPQWLDQMYEWALGYDEGEKTHHPYCLKFDADRKYENSIKNLYAMVQIYQGVGGRVMQSFDTALFNIVREARRFSHVHDQYAWFLEMANQKELLLEMMNAHVS